MDICDGVVDVFVGDFISSGLRKVFESLVDWDICEVLDFFWVSCFE
jgi:hypothetical protein